MGKGANDAGLDGLLWSVAAVVILAVACGTPPPEPNTSRPPIESVLTPSGSGPRSSSPAATPSSGPLFRDPIGAAVDDVGNVWIGDYRLSTLQMFRAGDVTSATGEARVDPAVTLSEVGGPNQLEFDAHGNLWVVEWDEAAVASFAPSALIDASGAGPTFLLTDGHLAKPTDLAFDRSGNLWVANQENGEILEFTADQLGATGHPEPALVLRPSEVQSGSPEAIAFDDQGWLWVSSYYDDVILGFDVAHVDRFSSATADVRLALDQNSGPIGLTVDESGQLWVAEAVAQRVVAFGPGLSTGTSPTPVVVLDDESLVMPHSVTFDRDGNAWIPCYNATVLRFDRAQLQPGAEGPPSLILG